MTELVLSLRLLYTPSRNRRDLGGIIIINILLLLLFIFGISRELL